MFQLFLRANKCASVTNTNENSLIYYFLLAFLFDLLTLSSGLTHPKNPNSSSDTLSAHSAAAKPIPEAAAFMKHTQTQILQTHSTVALSHIITPASDQWHCEERLRRDILSTHSSAAKPIPAAALLKIVENTLKVTTKPYQPTAEEISKLESLGSTIHKISCELSSNCSMSQSSITQRTLNLLMSLELFNWDAKIIIILAGFATNFAEYVLIDEVYTNSTTAKGLLQLKRLGQMDTGNNYGFVRDIIMNVANIAKYILAIKAVLVKLTTPINEPDFLSSTYWVIYAVLICSSAISGHGAITTMHVQYIKEKIDVIYHDFNLKLKEYEKVKREEEIKIEYEMLVHLFGGIQDDNSAILKHLLHCGENEELICGMDLGKTKINLSVLKKGTVIVLLSSLYVEAYREEVSMIKAFYNMTNTNNDQYHILWLPIGYKKEDKHKTTYTEVVHGKPWYHLRFESLAEQYVVLERYAIKEWGFNEKPMVMVLNNGQLIHHDALSLIHMWGHLAFPFGMYKEKDLWSNHGHKLGIQFILAYLHDDLYILENDQTPQYVCVFGGSRPNKAIGAGNVSENGSALLSDAEWFGDLAGMLMAAALPANIKLKMAYFWANREEAPLGMSIKTKVESSINGTQYEECMQYVQVEQANVKLFWSRVKSIALQLSMQKEYETFHANMDSLLKNTRSILQFNVQSTAWVAIGQLGTTDMIFHDATEFFNCLECIDSNREKWNAELIDNDFNFIKVLGQWLMKFEYERNIPIKKHCFKHVVHGDAMQKGGMHCVICNKPMKKVLLYECCE